MSPPWDEDERERPSWREIDRKRDRSRHVTPEPRRRGRHTQTEWSRQQALKQAEALFAGKRVQPEYQQALRRLENQRGTPKFQAVAKKFMGAYGLPDDWNTLILLLDYQEPTAIMEVLKGLQAQLKSRSRVEQQGFKGKLRTIALTTRDAALKKTAEAMLAEL